MPIAELNVISEQEVTSVSDFVKTFKLETQFEKEYGCSIDDWEYPIGDYEVIENLLKKTFPKQVWIILYHEENDGYFQIYELHETEPISLKYWGMYKEK